MRTIKRREEFVRIYEPTEVTGSIGGVVNGWTATPSIVRAIVQPMSSASMRAEYGERADRMMLVVIPNDVRCEINWGVRLSGETGDPWHIVSKSVWLHLANLTIEKR